MTIGNEPPIAKYRYTVTIEGNSHEEIESELIGLTCGGYLLDSDYLKLDEFESIGGRRTTKLEHTNPDQTPEKYDAEMDEWWQARKANRMDGLPGGGE